MYNRVRTARCHIRQFLDSALADVATSFEGNLEMNVSKTLRGILAASAIALSVSACATGSGNRGGIYAGQSEDVMTFMVVYSSSGQPSVEQYMLAQEAAVMCGVQIDPQLSSAWESRLSGATSYAIPYGLSGAAQYAYPGATAATAGAGAVVGIISGAGAGYVYGDVINAQNRATMIGQCVNDVLSAWRTGGPIPESVRARFSNVPQLVNGLYARGSLVRTNNSHGDPAWSGAQVGDTVGRRQ